MRKLSKHAYQLLTGMLHDAIQEGLQNSDPIIKTADKIAQWVTLNKKDLIKLIEAHEVKVVLKLQKDIDSLEAQVASKTQLLNQHRED